jgi:hypothetical protein
MRVFLFAFLILASVAQAHAQDKMKGPDSCSYELRDGHSYVVAAGETLCWRVPAPQRDYTLLRCDPPLREIVRVKRGDHRCGRYEDRQ